MRRARSRRATRCGRRRQAPPRHVPRLPPARRSAASSGESEAPRRSALLFVLVWQAASPRPEGGSVTGSVPDVGQGAGPSAAPGGAPAADPHVAELRAALEKNPDDHDARLELARLLLLQRDLMGVWNETQ